MEFSSSYSKSTWGPIYWNLLHQHILSAYPPKDINLSSYTIQKMKNFINRTFPELLPCDKCRESYLSYMNRNSIGLRKALKSRMSLTYFMFNFHNVKNKELDKPIFSWSQFLAKYGNNRQSIGGAYSQQPFTPYGF